LLVTGTDGVETTLEVRSIADPDATVGMAIAWRVMCEVSSTGRTP